MDTSFLLKNLNKLDGIYQFYLHLCATKTNHNFSQVAKSLESCISCLALDISQKLDNNSQPNAFFDEFERCEKFFNESLQEEIINKDLLLSDLNHVKDFAIQYRKIDTIYITNNSDLQALKEKILLIISEKFG